MAFRKTRDIAEHDQPVETDVEGEIREFVRRDVVTESGRQPDNESQLVANNINSVLQRATDLHIACHRIEPAINAILSREPDAALAVESRGVEIGVRHALSGQRPYLDLLCRGIDAHNGILAAVGEPGGAVRPDEIGRAHV